MATFCSFGPTHRETGAELWRTDGTAAGTWLVGDLNRGPGGSNAGGYPWTRGPIAVHDAVMYFGASDPAAGYELWRSDSTPDGTWHVADVWPGPDSSAPLELTIMGDDLYFAATDGASGRELYRLSLVD